MVAVNYTNLDFDRIKTNLKEFLRSQSTWSDYDFEGSNISMLLDLLAYNSQYAGFLANMISNESYLDSASVRDNVVLLARQLGYTPTSVTGAYGFFDLQFQLSPFDYPAGFPLNIEIRPGPVYSVTSFDSTSYTLSTVDSIVSSVPTSGVITIDNIKLTEGLLVEETFTVNNSNPLQVFKLDNQNIDISSIRVEVQELPPSLDTTTYVHINTLTDIDALSRVYWVDEVDDRYYKLTFGDNVFGYRPGTGAIVNVRYLVCNGPKPNGIKGNSNFAFIGNVYDSNDRRVITDPVIQNEPKLEGGSDIETVASIKLRSTKGYIAQHRAVTSEDYETIIRGLYPAAEDVYVYGGETLTPPQYGRVFIVIKPTNGVTLSNRLKNEIELRLREYKVASTDIEYVDPGILNIEVTSNVYYTQNRTKLTTDAIRSKVVSSLSNYSQSTAIRKFGGNFLYSKVVALVDDSDKSITRNDTYVTMRRDVPVLFNTSATYYVTFGNSIKTDTNKSVISSSGFSILESNNTYYLEDDGNGRIYSYHFDGERKKTVGNLISGTVDYTNGIVKIGYDRSIIVTRTEIPGVIMIRAIPAVPDIFAKNEIFLQFDVSHSTINVVPE